MSAPSPPCSHRNVRRSSSCRRRRREPARERGQVTHLDSVLVTRVLKKSGGRLPLLKIVVKIGDVLKLKKKASILKDHLKTNQTVSARAFTRRGHQRQQTDGGTRGLRGVSTGLRSLRHLTPPRPLGPAWPFGLWWIPRSSQFHACFHGTGGCRL